MEYSGFNCSTWLESKCGQPTWCSCDRKAHLPVEAWCG